MDADTPAIKISALYADNVMYLVAVQFEIPGEKWSEFEGSPMYRQLKAYVHSLQIPDKQIGRNVAGDTAHERGDKMLRRSYGPLELDTDTLALAKKLTALILDSAVSYKKALTALEGAMELLEEQTKPVSLPAVPKED